MAGQGGRDGETEGAIRRQSHSTLSIFQSTSPPSSSSITGLFVQPGSPQGWVVLGPQTSAERVNLFKATLWIHRVTSCYIVLHYKAIKMNLLQVKKYWWLKFCPENVQLLTFDESKPGLSCCEELPFKFYFYVTSLYYVTITNIEMCWLCLSDERFVILSSTTKLAAQLCKLFHGRREH